MNIGVLASGAGTNLQALIDRVHGRDSNRIVAVASDRPDAPALERARSAGIDGAVFTRDDFADRAARDDAIAAWLREHEVELVVLAGYMQLLDAGFLEQFPRRVVNVHPALLPAFPGIGAVRQALDYGVKVVGVTVHFVDDGMDTGPIILQRALELSGEEDVSAVQQCLRPIEHDLLVEAVRLVCAGRVTVDPGRPRRVAVSR